MRQKKWGKTIARAIANVLNTSLLIDANTTSCVAFYQPEAPKE